MSTRSLCDRLCVWACCHGVIQVLEQDTICLAKEGSGVQGSGHACIYTLYGSLYAGLGVLNQFMFTLGQILACLWLQEQC